MPALCIFPKFSSSRFVNPPVKNIPRKEVLCPVYSLGTSLDIVKADIRAEMKDLANVIKTQCGLTEFKQPLEMTSEFKFEPRPESDLKMLQDMNFSINGKIEVSNFSNEWFLATITEIDYQENEVLIHFDDMPSKSDEWISMNSTRLRAAQITYRDMNKPSKVEMLVDQYIAEVGSLSAWSSKSSATVSKVVEDGIQSDLNINDTQIKAEPREEESYGSGEQYPVISKTTKIEAEHEDCGDSSEIIKLGHVKNEIDIDKIEAEEISIKDEQECTVDHLKNKNDVERYTRTLQEDSVNVKRNRTYSSKELMMLPVDASEVKIFYCNKCSFQSKSKRYLKRHTIVHKDPSQIEMFKCNKCSYQTKWRNDLNKHLPLHNESRKGKMLKSSKYMKLDLVRVENFQCDECTYQCKNKITLKRHLIDHKDPSDIEILFCYNCSYQTKHKKDLRAHVLIHMNKMFKCNECSHQFKEKYRLRKHLKIHKREIFHCTECAFQCKRKKNLTNHILKHTNQTLKEPPKMLECSECTYQCKSNSNLRAHMLIHKDPSQLEMFKCNICNFQTKHKSSLKSHSLLHSNEPLFKCNHCKYRSKRKGYLTNHMRVHKDPSQFRVLKCNDCSYECRVKRNLLLHILMVHTDRSQVKILKCKECAYQTQDRGNYHQHLVIHKDPSQIKMFKCNICSYQFKRKYGLQRHMMTHDSKQGETFKCDKCNYHGKSYENLQAHSRAHINPTQLRKFKCKICWYRFKYKPNLQRHMKLHHNKHKSEVAN